MWHYGPLPPGTRGVGGVEPVWHPGVAYHCEFLGDHARLEDGGIVRPHEVARYQLLPPGPPVPCPEPFLGDAAEGE